MRNQRGFSMIEIVVTIAIMGILMAAAAPGMGDWMQKSKARNTAESIQNGLQRARSEAVRLNRPVTFYMVSNLSSGCTLSSTAGSWVVSVSSPVGQCDAAPSTSMAPQVVAKGLVSDGGGATSIAASTGTTPATSVTFSGLGQVANASAATAIRQISVSSGSGSSQYNLRIEISLGGIGRLCDPAIMTATDSRACTNALTN